jgi:hypothetical protein
MPRNVRSKELNRFNRRAKRFVLEITLKLNIENMELLKVTKSGSLHFKLSDGRLGVSYSSGYVRVSTKGSHSRLYQINKQKFEDITQPYLRVERVLITLQRDRLNHLINFNNKNCK